MKSKTADIVPGARIPILGAEHVVRNYRLQLLGASRLYELLLAISCTSYLDVSKTIDIFVCTTCIFDSTTRLEPSTKFN